MKLTQIKGGAELRGPRGGVPVDTWSECRYNADLSSGGDGKAAKAAGSGDGAGSGRCAGVECNGAGGRQAAL